MSGGTIVGIVVAGVLTLLGAVVTAVIASRSNRQSTAVAFSETLIKRLEAVETRVGELETALTKSQQALQAAVRFIDRLIDWGRSGGRDQPPKPPASLHEYMDADAWDSRKIAVEEINPKE